MTTVKVDPINDLLDRVNEPEAIRELWESFNDMHWQLIQTNPDFLDLPCLQDQHSDKSTPKGEALNEAWERLVKVEHEIGEVLALIEKALGD